MAEAATDLRVKMEQQAAQLADLIRGQPSKELLGFLWAQRLMRGMTKSDAKESDRPILGPPPELQIALEYVHAVLACFPPLDSEERFDEAKAAEILKVAEELFSLSMFYCMASSVAGEKNDFGDETGEVEFAAKTSWVAIRGNRYQALEGEFFRYVLAPHDAVLKEIYGVGCNEVAAGVQAIASTFREGIANASLTMKRQMEAAYVIGDPERWRQEQPEAVELAKSAFDDMLFGGICNVSKHTKLPYELLKDLSFQRGENTEFFAAGDFSGTPLRTIPGRVKPLVEIGGDYYATDGSLVRDSAYRALQRAILTRRPDYRENWNRSQKEICEGAFPEIFAKQLCGANIYREVYYPHPDTGKWVECDVVIEIDDTLLVLESKAGVTAMRSPATNFESHVRAIQSLVVSAYEQSTRFLRYLSTSRHAPIFQLRGRHEEIRTISLDRYRAVIPIGITVESFSPFSTMCKELPQVKPILGKYPFISMSVDDMFALSKILTTGGELMHYLEVRQEVASIKKAMLFDEFDHLGAYIADNRFDMTLRDQLSTADKVFWDAFSSSIDRFFEVDDWEISAPPRQTYPVFLQAVLDALEESRGLGWLRTNSHLRNLNGEARTELADALATLSDSLKSVPYRYFALLGEDPLLLWLQRPEHELDEAKLQFTGQAVALAAKASASDALVITLSPPARIVRIRSARFPTPSALQVDYGALLVEAERIEKRKVAAL